MKGRHELKSYVNTADCAQLRARMRVVAKADKHSKMNGGYIVRSLYFDNYSDKAIIEKLSGQSRREKFRIRYYDEDTGFIRLEKKSKANRLTFKESSPITAEQCSAILSGDYECLKSPDKPLFMELYSKIRGQNLRPRNIVEYHREAFVYPAGNVRVTFDSNIRTSNNVFDFLNPEKSTIPAANAIVMETKYDGFLPDVIRDVIQIGFRGQTEFSKYVAARLV